MHESWQHFDHGADIGVRGIASDKASAFAQAALALTAVITEIDLVKPRLAVPIHCEAPDHELLLGEWLNTLIYEMTTRNMLFSRFEVKLDEQSLTATAWGEKVNIKRHAPSVEVKGATYTALQVARNEDGLWIAQCVVDV